MLAKLLSIIKPAGQVRAGDVIDEESHQWILETFSWAIKHFDVVEFKKNSQLVLPNNQFYQGSVKSVHEMALSIFEQTKSYAGMQQWPIILITPEQFLATNQQIIIPQFNLVDNCRGESTPFTKFSKENIEQLSEQPIMLSYRAVQVNQPQDLISSLVQNFASILIAQQSSLPPGGKEFIPQAVDIVACFLGFGVIFSNTAYQFKGGCGSCNNPNANRQPALPENETVYALALFCLLKSIQPKDAKPHLKPHLRKQFNRSYKALNSLIKTSDDPVLLSLL